MSKRPITCKIITVLLLGAMMIPAAGTIAADNENPAVSVTADKLSYDGKNYVATATGNVVIVRDQATMTGDQAVYNLKSAEADMEGHAAVEQPNMHMTSDKLHSSNKNYVVATGNVNGVYEDKKLRGDKVEYHLDQDYGIVTGNGYLQAQGAELWADTIQGWFKQIKAVGTGNVHIESPADNLIAYGNRAVYTQTPNQNDGIIHMLGNVRANQNGNSLTGDNVEIRLADNSVQTMSRSTVVLVPGNE
jgi:lipopolysaccharide export system protein LptA